MKEVNITGELNERDVAAAKKSLNSASFKGRLIRTDSNIADPEWKVTGGQQVNEHVHNQMNMFRKEAVKAGLNQFLSGVLQKFDAGTILTIAHHGSSEPVVPAARDLLHVYGPDRDDIRDWQSYYKYSWKDNGPNGIIYSTDAQIIREGKLECNSYA